MVLIDTSVWVRSFANLEPYTSELGRLADQEDVAGHELVFGELLIGDRGGRQKFLRDYSLLYQAQSVPHGEVVELVRRRVCTGVASAGSMFICWRPRWRSECNCGRPMRIYSRRPKRSASPTA